MSHLSKRRQPCLVIFLRAPQRGAVKRRLARDVGSAVAHDFYLRQSRRLIARLGNGPWKLALALTPDRLAAKSRFWPHGRGRPLRLAQGGGNLGERMARVMGNLPPGPVVIVGSDIPGIGRCHIRAAFDSLRRHETVFGPAGDGGYWLVGHARRRFPAARGLFRQVRWSSAHALADTRANLPPGTGIEAPPLERLEDIDDGAAYRRWCTGRPDGTKATGPARSNRHITGSGQSARPVCRPSPEECKNP